MFRKAKKKRLEKRLTAVMEKKELYDKQAEIKEVKHTMCRWHWPSTTKLLMAYIFLNCTAVEIYSMVVMYKLYDLSALYSLITAVVTETLSFAVYAAKAYNGKKQEEIIKLERDKMELDDDDNLDAETDGELLG